MSEVEEEKPTIELDPEAADDAAPVAAALESPQEKKQKISLDDMYLWLAVEKDDRQMTADALRRLGLVQSKPAQDVPYLIALANAVAFLIDNEADIREFIRAKRSGNAARPGFKRAGPR